MAPEQARGESAELDARADVYSIGAMLYHLLTGQVPYVPPGAKMSAHEILWRAIEGPPRPVHELAPEVPAELVAICEKAMARDAGRRYRDMDELRQDLAAFLEHRVVSAYATGALVELQKWVTRNRALAVASAGVVLAVIGGLGLALVLQRKSERNAVLADERGAVAEQRGEEVLHLSAFQRLADLERDADRLWPIDSALIDSYREWLGRAQRLVAELEPSGDNYYQGHRAKLAELARHGRPMTPAEREQELRAHPRFPELQRERERLERLRSVVAARSRRSGEDAFFLEASLPDDVDVLLDRAWLEVDPERTYFGHEEHGRALARRALDLAQDDATLSRAGVVLAWSQFALGRDAEALAELETAGSILPPEREGDLDAARVRIRAEQARLATPQVQERLEREVADLEGILLGPLLLRFPSEDERWWHWQLSKLVQAIQDFADPQTGLIEGHSPTRGLGVARRLELARTLDERAGGASKVNDQWRAAIASIADVHECPKYEALVIRPQSGLLPLGRDPDSGLWEFALLSTGEPPQRAADGRLTIGPESALVLVLLPGGTFWMGAQASAPEALNFDPRTQRGEGPVHRVRLSPFFLSKYEMTQGQWLRFTGTNPSRDTPESWVASWSATNANCDLSHPVESVDWDLVQMTLTRLGLTIPSEAQWEYGARAGTTTVRWTGDEPTTLVGAANVCDAYAHAHGGENWGEHEAWLNDGFTSHAPVGTFRPNAFGLHEVLGNVWEWCLDAYMTQFYARSPALDPVCDPGDGPMRVARGGGIYNSAGLARSAMRYDTTAGLRDGELGVRPARVLER
jgi:formylglycine-generating enzyme required for sulfatase activity